MRRSVLGTAALLLAIGVGTAHAQSPVALELRGGGALPTMDLGNATLDPGAGFEIALNVRLQQHLRVYAGWDWYRFATDKPFRGRHYDVENTGYAFGLQFQHPVNYGAWGWARAGGIYNHIELENAAGDIIADSGHELGWEVGGGLRVPVGERFAFTPGVRYRRLSAELNDGPGAMPVDLAYVTAEIGFSIGFGNRNVLTALTR